MDSILNANRLASGSVGLVGLSMVVLFDKVSKRIVILVVIPVFTKCIGLAGLLSNS